MNDQERLPERVAAGLVGAWHIVEGRENRETWMDVYEEKPFYRDRRDAGSRLARELAGHAGAGTLVLGIPRGGIPVAVEVADVLGAGLDVIIARKLQIPFDPEAGYGAVAEEGPSVFNESLAAELGLAPERVQRQVDEVRADIARLVGLYRHGLPLPDMEGRVAVLVDDGLASGFTMIAAIKAARVKRPASVVVAVPVASDAAFQRVRSLADEVVCPLVARTPWFAVASFYHRWYDVPDAEVMSILDGWRRRSARAGNEGEQERQIP
jgi:predicted phosphoribosyltransferase